MTSFSICRDNFLRAPSVIRWIGLNQIVRWILRVLAEHSWSQPIEQCRHVHFHQAWSSMANFFVYETTDRDVVWWSCLASEEAFLETSSSFKCIAQQAARHQRER